MQTKPLAPPKYRSVKLSVTVKRRFERKYGAAAREEIYAAIERWKSADLRRGIQTVHVAVDDSADMLKAWRDYFPKASRVRPISGSATPVKIKRAIDHLCKRLNPEYLVLFGGDDIVPMFQVDNPSHDVTAAGGTDWDRKLPTDNPYASSKPFRPEDIHSYLVPDRVIGRIPDMHSNGDPAWLVDYLATATRWKSKSASFYRKTYAICSSEMRSAGRQCMQRISKPVSELFLSPPTRDISTSARKRLSTRLHMIRCHGNPLDATFWGHDPDEDNAEKAWKRAITSTTLKARLQPATIVGTMCCYGAQIFSPKAHHARSQRRWPLASTYLRRGALAFVGSTKRAWLGGDEMGSADTLVADYFNRVLRGASIGRAFLTSKQKYIAHKSEDGGLADAMGEKTVIEYVLLGDPSIHPVGRKVSGPESALAAEERRQRRIVLGWRAERVCKLLPTRTPASPKQRAMAEKVFNRAQRRLGQRRVKQLQKFGIKPSHAIVQKLATTLHIEGEDRSGPGVIPKRRQSLEYYWGGHRGRGRHRQICMMKAETDLEGNVFHTEVGYSS